MSSYAYGRKALGICDRCGQQFRLNTLQTEWQGLKVCIECYEPKHPQLEPRRNVSDAIALYQPRPTPDDQFGVYLGLVGDSAIGSIGMKPEPLSAPTVAYTFTGNLTVTIT
jgi:hypothetical protein